MTEAEFRKCVRGSLPRLKKLTATEDWMFTIVPHAYPDDNRIASVDLGDYAHKKACIFMDPAKLESRGEVIDSLIHELLHTHAARFEQVYRMARSLAHTRSEGEMLEVAMRDAHEDFVRRIICMMKLGAGAR